MRNFISRLLVSIVLASGLGYCANADDDSLRQAMAKLAEDPTARQAAIDTMSASGDPRLVALLESFRANMLYVWQGTLVLCEETMTSDGAEVLPLLDPLSRQPIERDGRRVLAPRTELRAVRANRTDRAMASDGILRLELNSTDWAKRRNAVRKLGDQRAVAGLKELETIAQTDPNEKVRRASRESILLMELEGLLPGRSASDQLDAARELGAMRSIRARSAIETALRNFPSGLPEERSVYEEALRQIDRHQGIVDATSFLFQGLSRGSILILMALGLSITFGVMGVINMSHGELMMIGAVATYAVQLAFAAHAPRSFDWYFVVALPAAFACAGLVGYLMEALVVRHLYGRPLDTLLATWGIGLILIVTVRVIYGYNIGVSSPAWATGVVEVGRDIVVPYNRLIIMVICAACVVLLHGVLNRTRLGLLIRATMQNRETAASLGVNTRRIDACAFTLGAGLAGVAGWGVTLIDRVSPNMGANYIVDAFLVVVVGGVGRLAGVVWGGIGLGIADKLFLEPLLGAVWGKVAILTCIALFIQRRPQGLFPPKGRLADAAQ